MELKFIIALVEHRILGFLFIPYFIRREHGKDFFLIYERVTNNNIEKYEAILTPEEYQLVKYIEEYNDTTILKLFSKKKINIADFLNSAEEDLINNRIRPYIERRIFNCIELLLYSETSIFIKLKSNNLYNSDRLSIADERAETVFNFIKSGTGLKYFLTIQHDDNEIKLTDKAGFIIVNKEPCCLVLENKIYVFNDIDGKKLQPFFNKAFIEIPESVQKKYFETFVKNTISNYKVKAWGFDIVDQNIKPKPTLSIEYDLANKPVLLLKFLYNENAWYTANKKTGIRVILKEDSTGITFLRLIRDYIYENECITSLLELGLVNHVNGYFIPLETKKQQSDDILFSIINWINNRSDKIRELGYNIDQSRLNKKYYLDEVQLNFELSQKNSDWFDIHAIVKLLDHSIPFISLKNNIMNDNREFLLPDGSLIILPLEWFERYKDIFSFAKLENDGIMLDKQHFTLIKRSLHGINKKISGKLKKLFGEDEEIEYAVPKEIKAELRHYQKEGYNWIYKMYKNGFGACLADDMGLGKTLQTLTLLQRVINETKDKEKKITEPDVKQQLSIFDVIEDTAKRSLPSLIIMPVSLIHNWKNEIKKFSPELKVADYSGSTRKDFKEYYYNADIILTSYGLIRNEIEELKDYNFLYIVLDESQIIKNPGSKTYKAIMQLDSEYRLVLTGTPVENSLLDLWSQMNFLNNGLLGNLNFFKSEFVLPIEKHNDKNRSDKLKLLIKPFILRRTKNKVERELPELTEQFVYCEMTLKQNQIYEEEKSKARNFIIESFGKGKGDNTSFILLQTLTKLRQICNHPLLIDTEYMGDSGKYSEVIRMLENLKAEGHKTLIFSSFVKQLDIYNNYFTGNHIQFARLVGETKNREEVINKFNQQDDINFFLISLKAGGVGLNLTAADYVVMLDPWWNPAVEQQAINRTHRIGQTKNVFVYKFITKNSIEEKILNLQEKKSLLVDTFVNSNNPFKNLNKNQILELFE